MRPILITSSSLRWAHPSARTGSVARSAPAWCAPASTRRAVATSCATASPPSCSRAGPTSVTWPRCSVMPGSRRHSAIPASASIASGPYTPSAIRPPGSTWPWRTNSAGSSLARDSAVTRSLTASSRSPPLGGVYAHPLWDHVGGAIKTISTCERERSPSTCVSSVGEFDCEPTAHVQACVASSSSSPRHAARAIESSPSYSVPLDHMAAAISGSTAES